MTLVDRSVTFGIRTTLRPILEESWANLSKDAKSLRGYVYNNLGQCWVYNNLGQLRQVLEHRDSFLKRYDPKPASNITVG